MRACSRVALVLMVLSASFGLAGCAAIDDLKFAIAQWFEVREVLGRTRVLPDNDLPNATPMIPPDKIPKKAQPSRQRRCPRQRVSCNGRRRSSFKRNPQPPIPPRR